MDLYLSGFSMETCQPGFMPGFRSVQILPGVAFGMFFDGKQLPPGMRQTCFAFAGLLHLPVPATGDVRRLDAVLEKEARSTGSI